MSNNQQSVLKPDAIYFGDNGRAFCGDHAGHTASMTGRDLDGRKVHAVTKKEHAEWKADFGTDVQCESCQAGRKK
tara:strand:- start:23322 stop:23546 length:225 start_codon:yes stop_codon:yes gene_type:complete